MECIHLIEGGPHGAYYKTTHSSKDGVIVIRLTGAMYFGEESTSPRILVKELLDKSRQIVLDLGDVTHIDSGGLGTLVSQ